MARLPAGYVDKTDWARLAKPLSLLNAPVHRWFVFPHSYSATLVERIIDAWGLNADDRVLDPFVGAGTTLVVSKSRGIASVGLDVSPLSVLVSRVKTANYAPDHLAAEWRCVRGKMPRCPSEVAPHPSRLVQRAFTARAWVWLVALRDSILSVSSSAHREFLQVAYLRTMREVCRAVSDGGWLRWTGMRPSGRDLIQRMDRTVATMIADLETQCNVARGRVDCEVLQADARFPPKSLGKVSAVICSPPYPNRHDYSRVFAPELLLHFCDEDGLKEIRYGSFRSHVEAKAPKARVDGYVPPPRIAAMVKRLKRAPITDRRVPSMVRGYFHDSFLMLRALRPHLRKGSRLAFVVGNVRHAGVMVEVDEGLARIAEGLGYLRDSSWVIRYRGNSAQQMGTFGRSPARESIVMLRWGQGL